MSLIKGGNSSLTASSMMKSKSTRLQVTAAFHKVLISTALLSCPGALVEDIRISVTRMLSLSTSKFLETLIEVSVQACYLNFEHEY